MRRRLRERYTISRTRLTISPPGPAPRFPPQVIDGADPLAGAEYSSGLAGAALPILAGHALQSLQASRRH